MAYSVLVALQPGNGGSGGGESASSSRLLDLDSLVELYSALRLSHPLLYSALRLSHPFTTDDRSQTFRSIRTESSLEQPLWNIR
eukprot:764643-Hanusia_phi.AAC.2